MTFAVTVSTRGVRGRVDARTVHRRAIKLLTLLDKPHAELSVVLCGDDFIAELNQSYRGKSGPTDVLSFAMAEGEDGDLAGPVLGDVVISLDTAQRQAFELQRSLLDEVTSLLVHGVLHLMGFDHVKAPDARRMFARAAELEKQIGRRTPIPRKNFTESA
jgi:probable rRNA maturation factor